MGRIVKPHGLRGEVVVELVTNRLERLAPGTELALRRPGDAPGGQVAGPTERLVVVGARPHGHRYLVWFAGVDDVDAAEALRAAVLLAEPLEDPSALFVHELIGAEVVDGAGGRHGRVVSVEANPASDLLVLEGGELVPLVFVVDRRPGEVVVDAPEGLLG